MCYTVFTLTPCSHNNNLTYLFRKKLNYSSYFATVCKEPCIMNNLARFYHYHLNETAWVGKRKHQHTSQQMKRLLLEYRRHKTLQHLQLLVLLSNLLFLATLPSQKYHGSAQGMRYPSSCLRITLSPHNSISL